MNSESIIKLSQINQSYRGWTYLNIPELNIPKGFSIALIGENGAGKSTLLKIIAGVLGEYSGKIDYFNNEVNFKKIKNNIGYVGTKSFLLDTWNINDISKINQLSYDQFSQEKFKALCDEFEITDTSRKYSKLSDGMKMKVSLASVFARECKLLLLDEPSSSLDPVSRELLCSKMQEFIAEGNAEKSIIFSTHNITDMEHITDYAIIMSTGKIEEYGSVEELKEKYTYVRGQGSGAFTAQKYIYNFLETPYGYEGLCLTSNLEKLVAENITTETPTLSQISTGLMEKANNPFTYRERN